MGFKSGFINKIFNRFVQEEKSATTFNYPFLDRGEENSPGEELKEELETLANVLKIVDLNKYSKINFVAKSLGAIVASYFLLNSSNKDLLSKVNLFVLGYVKGSINLENLKCKIVIIQGEKDRFGNIEEVKKDFLNTQNTNIKFIEIAKADHSYRDELKQPIFEDLAIEELFSNL